jgi:hypothetical protein
VSTPVKLLSRAVATAFNGGFLKIVDSGSIKTFLDGASLVVNPSPDLVGRRVLVQLYKGQKFASPHEEAIVSKELNDIAAFSSLGDSEIFGGASADALVKIAKSRQASCP